MNYLKKQIDHEELTKELILNPVYRWNGDEHKLPNLDIEKNGNIKVK
ncbi:hypothetical protein [Spiroplasma endosymbiont of Phyllotreta cruciferae]|nr:hypothetical protein [Spiroplasma endosymbiont of Phyllotreta cruciferae]